MKNISLFTALVLAIGSLFSGVALTSPVVASEMLQEKGDRDELEELILKKIEQRKKELASQKGKASKASKANPKPKATRGGSSRMRANKPVAAPAITAATGGESNNPKIPRVRQSEKTPQETKPTVMSAGRNENIDPDVRIKFSFSDEEWKDVIEWFAEQIGYGLFYGDTNPPSGTISYIDSNEFTLIEAMDFLNSRLAILSPPHVLVRNGNQPQLVLVNESGNYPAHLIDTIREGELDFYGEFEVASCEFDLGKLSGNVLSSQLREDVADVHLDGFVYYEAANRLVIRERVRILRRFKALIDLAKARLDTVTVQTYQCQNIEPQVLLVTLRPMMGFADDVNTLDDGTLSMAIQPLGDKIFLKGTPERIGEFMKTAALIDIEIDGGELDLDKPYFKVYRVSGDLEVIFQVAQTLLDGVPNVRLDKDEQNGALFVEAPQQAHDRMDEALAKMSGEGGDSFAVIDVKNMSPSEAVQNVEDLLGIDPFAESSSGPRLVSDSNNDRVMVHGTPQEIKLVRRMIADIDTPVGSSEGPRRNTRMIQLSPRQSDTIARYLEIPGIMDVVGRENRLKLILPKDRNSFRNRSQIDQRIRRRDNGSTDRNETNQGSGSRNNGASDQRGRRIRTSYQVPLKSSLYASTGSQENPFRQENDSAEKDLIGQTTAGNGGDDGALYQTAEEKPSIPGAPIDVRFTEQGLVIYSEDLDAADDLESMIKGLIDTEGTLDLPTFIYLENRKVSEVKSLLEGIFGISSASGGGGGGVGDFIGGALKNAVGGAAGGALDGLLGGGGGGDGLSSGSGLELEGEDVQFSMDVRSNALIIIGATTGDLEIIDEMIVAFDIDSPPQDPNLQGKTYSIRVLFRDAMDVKSIVESQLPDFFRGVGGGQANRNPQQNVQEQIQQQVLRQLQGGNRRNRGGGGGGGNADSEQPKATLTVDELNNSLLLTGPEFIYLQVFDVVKAIDIEKNLTTQVVDPSVSPDVYADLLRSVFGDVIVVNNGEGAGEGAAGSSSSGSQPSAGGRAASGRGGSSSAGNGRQIERQIRNAIQGGGGRVPIRRGGGGVRRP